MGELEELYRSHSDEVAFLVVYIREAHPEDGWVLLANREDGIALADPATQAERAAAAGACVARLRTELPVLLDGTDDAVALAYGGWPDRLYLVGRDGRVAFQGDVGPDGFRPAELAQAIETELGAARRGERARSVAPEGTKRVRNAAVRPARQGRAKRSCMRPAMTIVATMSMISIAAARAASRLRRRLRRSARSAPRASAGSEAP